MSCDGAGGDAISVDHGTTRISTTQRSEFDSEYQQACTCPGTREVQSIHGEAVDLNAKAADSNETCDGIIDKSGRVMDTPTKILEPTLPHPLADPNKPISIPFNLAQSGCFRPFPSKAVTQPAFDTNLMTDENDLGRSSKKRRRSLGIIHKDEVSLFPVQNLLGDYEETLSEHAPHRTCSTHTTTTKPIGDNNAPRINEIEATVEVGAMIGFEIDVTNKLLGEILGEAGGTNVP